MLVLAARVRDPSLGLAEEPIRLWLIPSHSGVTRFYGFCNRVTRFRVAAMEMRMWQTDPQPPVGIASLRRVLRPVESTLETFSSRVVAVDANNMLWSFVTAMGMGGGPPRDSDGNSIAHVIGLVNRLKLYADHDIRSAWVFDGDQPRLKSATMEERWARIEAAREQGDAAAGTALEDGQVKDAQALLTALGVPWLVAPCESDPQCAHFAQTGEAWAAVTQDYDAALHGSPLTGRNVTASRTRKPELMDLEVALSANGLTREGLVDAAILIGTDYNTGIPGVGPVKALKLVKEWGDLHGALRKLGATIEAADEIRALFLEHPVDTDARFAFRAPRDDFPEHLTTFGLSRERGGAIAAALRTLHATRS